MTKNTCCAGKTQTGKRCKRRCKNKYCHQHKGGNKNCQTKYHSYKDVCNKVWNAECRYDYNYESNRLRNMDAKDCAKQRMNYMNQCVPVDEWDENHLGAISKMVKKKDRCKEVMKDQKSSPNRRTRVNISSPSYSSSISPWGSPSSSTSSSPTIRPPKKVNAKRFTKFGGKRKLKKKRKNRKKN